MKPVRVRPRWIVLAALTGLLMAFTGGFIWFLGEADRPGSLPAHADGIVVLTGGAERIETGLRLLAAGRAERLLISGVHGAELADLTRRAGFDLAPYSERLTIGRVATSTKTNAVETAAWNRTAPAASLIVVTAGFHMPRALVELRRAVPGVTFHREPIRAGAKPPSLRTLGGEYIKWLAALAGLTSIVPAPPRHPDRIPG